MCDYSLHTNPNRLAKEGEDLVVYRFPTGSLGLASPDDLAVSLGWETKKKKTFWATVRSWFEEPQVVGRQVCAVCIPPGAELIVSRMPQDLQRELCVGESVEVTFTQISANAHSYRDAIRLKNGRQVLLQALREGQGVRVLTLGPAEVMEPLEIRTEVVFR
jgi:hypothetical protein